MLTYKDRETLGKIMFIQTEVTPNPASLKFLPGQDVTGNRALDYRSPEEAENSPLALKLFTVEGVEAVFLGHDFVTITKSGNKEWEVLRPLILDILMTHFSTNAPVFIDQTANLDNQDEEFFDDADAEIVKQIKEVLDTRIRPAVAQDGGDIAFKGFEKGIVYLILRGACSGCPSSTATLKNGIENMLRHYFPEVEEVRAHGE
jgi:Fe-S cluster biogenesis protein NfuA